MAQALVNIRMDEELKRDFDNVCNELGMSMTTAITIFAKKMSREKRIPFDVSVDPFYTDSNLKALSESLDQLKSGKVVIKSIDELEGMTDE